MERHRRVLQKKNILNQIFLSHANFPLPRSEKEYVYFLGSLIGNALEIIPLHFRQRAIRFLFRKYHYDNSLCKNRKKMNTQISQILSDILTCQSSWKNNKKVKQEELERMKEQMLTYNPKRLNAKQQFITHIS